MGHYGGVSPFLCNEEESRLYWNMWQETLKLKSCAAPANDRGFFDDQNTVAPSMKAATKAGPKIQVTRASAPKVTASNAVSMECRVWTATLLTFLLSGMAKQGF
jgi:hypothetical protein